MLKNQAAAAPAAQHTGLKNVRVLATSALLAAISVVLARLIIPMPNETTRFSLEAVPIFIAGMLFGPIPGALVGFVADFVGCLFSGYGYNPDVLHPADPLRPVRQACSARCWPKKVEPRWRIAPGLPARDRPRLHPLSELVALAYVYGGRRI